MLRWVCNCLIFTCIYDWLLLNSTMQVLFFIALVFFNVFWEVLLSKVFKRFRFALEGSELGRGISSQLKSFSILLVSLKICLSSFLLSKTCGDGPRPTDSSPFIGFSHFALNLVDSAMWQCMLHQLRSIFFPPVLILVWAASARLDRLTLWVLDLNAMAHRYFTSSQKSSMFVSSLSQNSGCVEIKLINLVFSQLYPSSVTLFFSALTKTQNKSTSLLLKYLLSLSMQRSTW